MYKNHLKGARGLSKLVLLFLEQNYKKRRIFWTVDLRIHVYTYDSVLSFVVHYSPNIYL